MTDPCQDVLAPAAIARALDIYQQMQECDRAVLVQAKKILTEQVYARINAGECDEQRLVVGALARLKALDRERAANCERAIAPSPEASGHSAT
jgi:hypothetical protein